MQQIYLDNAATSIPDPYVLDAATTFAEKLRGASAASGDLTRFQTQLLVQARLDMAKFLNCRSNEIALVQSTSHALGTLAGALPLRPVPAKKLQKVTIGNKNHTVENRGQI